ncbi:hypothetical protein [Massilia phyllosphaerae]|uniref:hypothetical protein n=1 Tax=Massilia phyllosphaerae TaxID=3106034 RepID=UPI002B1CC25B|nr:hypothetical protein [Massilia sp. SGZ-792]
MLPVEQPFKIYTNLDGKPLDNGYVYFGQPNQNPQTAPITVYWDAAGTIPAAQPLRTQNGYIMRAGTPANVYLDGAYSMLILDSRRRQVSFARNSAEFSLAGAVKSFIASLAAAAGAALIGFSLNASAAVPDTLDNILSETVSVFRFMTAAQKADVRTAGGRIDLTAAVQAAFDYAYDNNIGTIYFPPGKYPITTIKRNWNAVRSVNVMGAGKRATVFVKYGAGTDPLFDWSANDNILETYSNFESFTIIGTGKAHHGIRATKCARFNMRDVYIGGCDRAIDNQGSLVWYGQGLSLQGNNYGLYTTRAANGNDDTQFIYPNAITLRDSTVCFNTTYGIYAEYANGMRLRDCDIEANGTSNNQSTGAVIFSQTNIEAGVGSVSIDGCWFERNYGWALTMDINTNSITSVSVKDTQFIATEAGRAARILTARSCLLEGVMAVSPTDTISVFGSHSTIINSTISTINDTSTRSTWVNVVTSADPVGEGGFSNGLNVSNGKPLTLSWGRGAGKATFTPDTNSGHLDYATQSGLHRFKNQIGFFEPVPLANARAQAMFVDAADNKLKFKDINGVVTVL